MATGRSAKFSLGLQPRHFASLLGGRGKAAPSDVSPCTRPATASLPGLPFRATCPAFTNAPRISGRQRSLPPPHSIGHFRHHLSEPPPLPLSPFSPFFSLSPCNPPRCAVLPFFVHRATALLIHPVPPSRLRIRPGDPGSYAGIPRRPARLEPPPPGRQAAAQPAASQPRPSRPQNPGDGFPSTRCAAAMGRSRRSAAAVVPGLEASVSLWTSAGCRRPL